MRSACSTSRPRPGAGGINRNLAFRRNQGLRIDHVLVSEGLRPLVRACAIDKAPRQRERPSDHAPILVEIAAG